MAGAFLAGGSAAPIAAFTAIARRGRRRFAPARAGAKRRMARGSYFASRCKAAPPQRPVALGAMGKKLGAAAENSCPRAIANRLRAAAPCIDRKDQPPPGASGRSPLVKAAARLFPARAYRPATKATP